MAEKKLKLGVAGLGRAFQLMLPTLVAHEKLELVAGADPREEARARFGSDFGARSYASVEELCGDASIDAIYVATPHQFHAANVTAAARAGKHVLVEKPMALTLEDCRAMTEAAGRAGVQLVVGHSHSFDGPVLKAAELIASGAFGRPRMITAINFTDFLFRPRRKEELSTELGGGVLFNQAPHHVEVIRMLHGGKLKSVRALSGAWDEQRPTEGAYSALLTFEDGAFATITYSGYAHFDSDELESWIAESGHSKDPNTYGATRRMLKAGRADEETLKQARNYGGPESGSAALPGGARFHQHFGFVIASCEHADLRPTATGVVIYGDEARRFEPVPVPKVPRSEVIDEFCAAIFDGKPPLHGGAWSLATMEACLAMLKSAREGREVQLEHQIGIPR